MTEKQRQRQKQLDKAVESKIKGIGLDALFHLVDVGKKGSQSPSSHITANPEDNLPLLKRLKNRLCFLAPRNIERHLKNVFSAKPDFIIGISVDSMGVKIIELKNIKGSVHLNNARYIPIPRALSNSKEKSEEFITSIIKETLDPQTTKNAYLCSMIPRSKVIIKFFSLPTVDPAEIESMVELEAEHHVPIALNECIFDYDILYNENGHTHLVFATIKKEEIDQHLKFLGTMNLQPSAVDISSLALYNTLAWEKSQEGCIAHINIGADDIDINITENGRLKTSRGIPWGLRTLTNNLSSKLNVNLEIAEKMQKENGIVIKKTLKNDVADSICEHTCAWAQKLINEIKETIRHFQFQQGVNEIDRIILTGEGSRLLNLSEYLKDQLNIKASLQEPPKVFEQSDAHESFYQSYNELSIMTGLAGKLWKEHFAGVNLLPHHLKNAFEQKKQVIRRWTALSLAAFAFLVLMVLPAGIIGARNQYIHHVEKKIARLESEATKILALSDKVQTIEDYRSISRSCIEVLREISLLVSLDITINQFTFEQNEHVILVGEAESHVSVVNLSRAVRESEIFEDAILKYTRKKDRLKNSVDFEIVCKLKK